MWHEVETVIKENRHELLLNGSEISKRLIECGLDKNIFKLISLNLLQISDTCLNAIPADLSKLDNLQTLILHSNKLTTVPKEIGQLAKLKILDLSNNLLESIPDEMSELTQLTSLNLSSNKLNSIPQFNKYIKLSVLNISHNKLDNFANVCQQELTALSELNLKGNVITVIPKEINLLSALKILDLSVNQIKSVPGEITDCNKLKELNLKENPIQDKRFLKLITQCHTKQVLDYARQHCLREGSKAPTGGNKKSNKKIKNEIKKSESEESVDGDHVVKNGPKIIVSRAAENGELPNVKITEEVKNIRPYIVGCVIKSLTFDQNMLQKFLRMQTKLHETICEKRSSATIATHDLSKIINITANGTENQQNNKCDITYTAKPPNDLQIRPLNRNGVSTGAQLFKQLRTEAENYRREKKRNTLSGIHRYLHLLENKLFYPCVCDSTGKVISFPPITNSADTQIDLSTKDVFVEVTSPTSAFVCRKVLDEVLKETLVLFGNSELLVQQIKTVDLEGNLKTIYPSRADLNFEGNDNINVVREFK